MPSAAQAVLGWSALFPSSDATDLRARLGDKESAKK
jgi:hypothetical protein